MEKELSEQEKDLLYLFESRYEWYYQNQKSSRDSGVLIDGVTETVKHEIKKQEGGFLGSFFAPLAAQLVQPVISSVVKGISGRGFREGYMFCSIL